MKIDRVWAMPNSNTFSIKPISELIERYRDGLVIDPFANTSRKADITNDIGSDYECDYNMDAMDFLASFKRESVDVVLFDPPYSPRQVAECYRAAGRSVDWKTTQASFWGNLKREIGRIVRPGGTVITCGWNSGGVGKTHGFKIVEILLVPHGGWHNDTIVTVDKRD